MLRLNAFVLLKDAERITGECSGDGALARFDGRVLSQKGQDVTIRFTTALCYEPATTTIRIKVEGIEGTVGEGQENIRLIMMDVSPRSFGGIVDKPLGIAAEMKIRVDAPAGPIYATARVMNCRATDEPGCFRVGMIITDISRLDDARWARFVDEMIAA